MTIACASPVYSAFDPDFSLILDGRYKSSNTALSEQEKGFGLGHLELGVSAPIDDLFYGKFTGVLHQHHNKTEFEAEEAFFQTLALPAGFSIRAGRFLSNVGYLNSQHTHNDSFTDRPGVYRGLLGSHYFDDGVRLEFLFPTDLYWTAGVEVLSGKKMQAHDFKNPGSVGVYTGYTKIGGDIGISHSWQLGLSYLHNRNGTFQTKAESYHEHGHGHGYEHEYEHEHAHVHEPHHELHHPHDHHDHHHGAQFTGKHLYGIDAVWKWAPGGNYKYQSLALSGEYLRAQDTREKNSGRNYHDGWYLSSVYQFTSQWATGLRYGEFNGTRFEHELQEQTVKETELILSWSHSHFSTIRLQYTHQKADGFKDNEDNAVTLQFIMSLGAHDAHQY